MFLYILNEKDLCLVGKCKTPHTRLHTKHVVVRGEHVHGGVVWDGALHGDRNLSIVNAGEVAGARWLVLFWAKRERVGVDAWVWAARVVGVGLHLVEILTRLFLHTVLAVKDKFDRGHRTNGAGGGRRPIFRPRASAALGTAHEEWRTGGLGDRGEVVGFGHVEWVRIEDNRVGGRQVGGEVPHGGVSNGAVVEAPDKFFDWVVVGEAHLAGRTRGDRVGASVLDLFDKVFVALLREAAAFFRVQVNIVTPHFERGAIRV